MDDFRQKKAPQMWGSPGYLLLIVIAVLICIFVLKPFLQSAMNPFQVITSALGGH